MEKLSRRQMLKLVGAAAAGSLAACVSPQPRPATPETKPSAPPAPAAVRLSYWGHAYDGRVKVVEAVLADFKSTHPNITVDHQTLPDLWDKLPASFAAGTQPDIFSIDNSVLPRYVEANQLVPVDPTAWGKRSEQEVIDLFEPGTVDYLRYKDHFWGPPMEVSVHSPAYRLDHFKEYGLDPDNPPDTYEEFAEIGARVGGRFDAEGKRTRQWMEWYGPGHWPVLVGPMLAGAGGWWINEDGTKATLNTPAGIRTLKYWYDSFHTWKINDPAFASPDDRGHFIGGRETYAWHNFPGSRWISTTFENMVYGTDWKLQKMFKWADGERKNIGYAYGFFVTTACKTPAEAWKFIEALTHFPERTEQWIDVAGLVQTYRGWTELPKVKPLPFVKHFNQEFEWSIPHLKSVKVNEINVEITKALQRLMATPPDDPETVAKDFDAAVDAILGA